ncbi:hypothetical protein NNJEOMEG_01317 [Fundidesulfovibrio magnetotacticus]|uniref:Uncharacterized protein n=2 Tax=Fundidesulfovibrio magnetotacticus TaxID=2730080 RepID=A0A6V8LP42_9BACT|nr:hypothetical protein NNJEOMEG_01317 [Fundidesulfovibrio magnetotacticus]
MGHAAKAARSRRDIPFGGLGICLDAALFRAARMARSRFVDPETAGKARVRPFEVPLWGFEMMVAYCRFTRAG